METRLGVVPSFSAAAVTDSPSSRASTISARSRSRTVLVLARDLRRNSFTTSASAAIRLIGRAIRVILPQINRDADFSRYLRSWILERAIS